MLLEEQIEFSFMEEPVPQQPACSAVTYQELRSDEYPPMRELIVALWEMVVEGRPQLAHDVQVKRMEVKLRHAKPKHTDKQT